MSYSAIMKETGRATHDELRRLRQRLDFVEQYRGAIEQSLVRTQNPSGPAGVGLSDTYLKLDASNDPVTGALACSSSLSVTGAVTFASTLAVTGLATFSNTVAIHTSVKGLDVFATTSDSAIMVRVAGSDPDTLSPANITNKANNLLMWFESDTLGLSDGNDVQTWSQAGTGLSSDQLLQATASVAPHYRTGETPTGKPGVIAEVIGHRMSKSEVDGVDWKFGVDQGGGTDVNSAFIVVYRTDDLAVANNILTMGNEDSAGSKTSFRPVGNSALGNSYVYDNGSLIQVGSGHAGHAGGTWHIALFWYDSSDDSVRVWIDGTNYDVPTTQDLDMDVDVLFRDVGGGTEGVNVGTGVAAMVLIASNGGGAQIGLTEAQKVHDFIALEYMGTSFTINAGAAAGDLIQLQDSTGTVLTVFDDSGNLHIGGSNPTVALDVEGAASISGALDAGSLSVAGSSTLSDSVFTGDVVVLGGLQVADPDGTTILQIKDSNSGSSMLTRIDFVDSSNNVDGVIGYSNSDVLLIQSSYNNDIAFKTQNTTRWSVKGDGSFRASGDHAIFFGAANDASVVYDGTDLTINPRLVGTGGVKIASPAVIMGDRTSFACSQSVTADGYFRIGGINMQAALGFLATRPGSILGLGISQVDTLTTVDDNMTFEVRKNGTAVFSATIFSTVTSTFTTQARAVDTFVAGDVLSVYCDVGASYNATRDVIANVELIYDE